MIFAKLRQVLQNNDWAAAASNGQTLGAAATRRRYNAIKPRSVVAKLDAARNLAADNFTGDSASYSLADSLAR